MFEASKCKYQLKTFEPSLKRLFPGVFIKVELKSRHSLFKAALF